MRDGPGDRAPGTGAPPDGDPGVPLLPFPPGSFSLSPDHVFHFNTDLVAGICFPGLRRERRPGLRGKRTGRCPGRGPRGAEQWGMVRTPKLFPHALYLFDCLYPSPRTPRFCVAARCVRICCGDFRGSWGRAPLCSLRLSPRCCASPRRREPGRAFPPRTRGAAGRPRQGGGGGERAPGRGGGRGRPSCTAPPAPRPPGIGGGRGGIPLSIPAIFRAWEPGKQNALAISSRR